MRALGWETQAAQYNQDLLDDSQRPYYLLQSAECWLNLTLDLIVAAEAIIAVALTTSLRSHTNAGLLGVAMNNILCQSVQ